MSDPKSDVEVNWNYWVRVFPHIFGTCVCMEKWTWTGYFLKKENGFDFCPLSFLILFYFYDSIWTKSPELMFEAGVTLHFCKHEVTTGALQIHVIMVFKYKQKEKLLVNWTGVYIWNTCINMTRYQPHWTSAARGLRLCSWGQRWLKYALRYC